MKAAFPSRTRGADFFFSSSPACLGVMTSRRGHVTKRWPKVRRDANKPSFGFISADRIDPERRTTPSLGPYPAPHVFPWGSRSAGLTVPPIIKRSVVPGQRRTRLLETFNMKVVRAAFTANTYCAVGVVNFRKPVKFQSEMNSSQFLFIIHK